MLIEGTTNFIFLKGIKPELYKLAVKMEEDLLITPISILAYSTRFLEYIIHDIANKNNFNVDQEKAGFIEKVNQLIRFNYLDNNLGQLLIDAYLERNKSIHSWDIDKSLKLDKKTAFNLNETLFYVADAYYKKLTGNDETHIYTEPKLINESQTIDFKQDSTPHDNNSTVKHKAIKKSKKEEHLVKKEMDKPKTPVFTGQKQLDESQISNIEKQENINDKSLNVSQDIDETVIVEFVKLLEDGYSQQSALKHAGINNNIVNDWYVNRKYAFIDGFEDSLFIHYNELLIENTIKSIIENNGLGNNGQKVEFWMQHFEDFIDEHSKNLTEDQLKVFRLVFKRNTPKEVKPFMTKDKSEKHNPVKSSIDEKELEKRKLLMLENIEKFNFNISLKKSKLPPMEVQKSKKEFLDGKRNNFYHKLSEKLMKQYLISRNNGKSTLEFCKKAGIEKFEVDFWINDNYFKDFQIRYNRIRMHLFEDAMKNNKSLEGILQDLEMNAKQFNELVRLVSDDADYIGVRNIVKKYYYPYYLEVFVNEFRKNPNIDDVLKKSNLRKEDVEKYLPSNKRLYDEFNQIKIKQIEKNKLNNEKVNLNQLDMTPVEYSQLEDEIDKRVEDKKIKELTNGLPDGMLLVAANNIGCNSDIVFEWIFKGSVNDNKYSQFANRYWETHIDYINALKSDANNKLKVSQINLEVFGLKTHMHYWKKWGLFDKNHAQLSINDIKDILRK